MATALFTGERSRPGLESSSDLVHLHTERALQLIDVTELVAERVRRSGVESGIVCVQTMHTTTGIMVNEGEPLLADDLKETLERLAPRGIRYAHDDIARRSEVTPEEAVNGHAHCKALLLAPSATLTVTGGRLMLGRWQRVFMVELDGGRRRSLSIVVLGVPGARPQWS